MPLSGGGIADDATSGHFLRSLRDRRSFPRQLMEAPRSWGAAPDDALFAYDRTEAWRSCMTSHSALSQWSSAWPFGRPSASYRE